MVARIGAVVMAALGLFTAAGVHAEGNRYGYPRYYKSDISPAAAYQALTKDKDTVLIDVRSIEEFVGGHAPDAVNVPYPRVTGAGKDDPGYIGMTDAEFLAEIVKRIPNRDTPIIAMCQGGGRSALAGNILAKAGYTNVRSVWSGYMGRTLTDTDGKPLDVNGNGVINGVTKDASGEVMKDPGDMDGWAGFNDLPTTKAIDASHVVDRFKERYATTPPAK